jgi:glucose/arabinose dehydrogenase
MRLIRSLAALALFAASSLVMAQTIPADLTLVRVPNASTLFSLPVALRAPNDNSGRLFVVEKCGVIKIIKNGALLATPFLTVPVNTGCSTVGDERGLLGLAFHPNFATNKKFYVAYTRSGGVNLGSVSDQLIAEYQVSAADSDIADASTARPIITIPDLFGNHNGGDIHFGPDGFLYYSMGDGGSANDPNEFAQNLWRKTVNTRSYYLLGKIMRIDINSTTPNASDEMCGTVTGQTAAYSIPPSNPMVGSTQTCDEIYHFGLRNPWRFSFDRLTNEMYIGDVGQGSREEIDVSAPGVTSNFGWKCREGTSTFFSTGSCNPLPANMIEPILEYTHSAGRCSMVGGFRYRGPITLLQGAYFYGDSCTGEIWIGIKSGLTWSSSVWTAVTAEAGFPYSLVAFGESQSGQLYAVDAGGKLLLISSPSNLPNDIFANGFE